MKLEKKIDYSKKLMELDEAELHQLYNQFEANYKLVPYTIRNYFKWTLINNDTEADEDLMQVGSIGLWRACLNYESSSGCTIKQ